MAILNDPILTPPDRPKRACEGRGFDEAERYPFFDRGAQDALNCRLYSSAYCNVSHCGSSSSPG